MVVLMRDDSSCNNRYRFIANRSGLEFLSVKNTVALIDDNATIPFIARYRKEATNNLDEQQIRTAIKE